MILGSAHFKTTCRKGDQYLSIRLSNCSDLFVSVELKLPESKPAATRNVVRGWSATTASALVCKW
jgi:hypothetical protein